ncbi:substrate-binding periplasmic protein [Undibacterium flavidum]|uniref:Transporter substrate-binding domain-containing protein n=1 Tax=Undibacterium flavidum TaxID=2762297 RepID=A0ABR6Y991_9BURK|nr:transporter substrate-binding domain-containing protein [Undibacterium flavidum]MBC3872797.1 transporter substrate-binding domain-containing protein [Undibacterium flavidum]
MRLFYPEILDSKGKQIPFTPEQLKVFQYFEKEAGLRFSIVILPWKRAQLEVERGAGLIYGFSKSLDRLNRYRFSQPIINLPIWAISYGPENAQIAELKDLKGKVIATSVGITHGIEFERARDTVFTVTEDFLSFQERLKKLIAKRSDVILVPYHQQISREQVEFTINRKLIPGFDDPELNGRVFNVSMNPIFIDTIHFASAKNNWDVVIDKIDVAIERGIKNGTLSKLMLNY